MNDKLISVDSNDFLTACQIEIAAPINRCNENGRKVATRKINLNEIRQFSTLKWKCLLKFEFSQNTQIQNCAAVRYLALASSHANAKRNHFQMAQFRQATPQLKETDRYIVQTPSCVHFATRRRKPFVLCFGSWVCFLHWMLRCTASDFRSVSQEKCNI